MKSLILAVFGVLLCATPPAAQTPPPSPFGDPLAGVAALSAPAQSTVRTDLLAIFDRTRQPTEVILLARRTNADGTVLWADGRRCRAVQAFAAALRNFRPPRWSIGAGVGPHGLSFPQAIHSAWMIYTRGAVTSDQANAHVTVSTSDLPPDLLRSVRALDRCWSAQVPERPREPTLQELLDRAPR